MTYSLSKKFLAATSALLLISMSAVPASAAADNSDAVSPLSAGNGLSEAAKPPAKIPPRSLFRLAPPRKGDGRSWSGHTVPWAWLITVRRR